jgi:hypothetical protein
LFLAAGEKEGLQVGELIERVTRQVIGMDLHPVAVTLARVTYLLAIGPATVARPQARRDPDSGLSRRLRSMAGAEQ